MKRRTCLAGSVTAPAGVSAGRSWRCPPSAPIEEPHFPNRLFQFVWRNWELADRWGCLRSHVSLCTNYDAFALPSSDRTILAHQPTSSLCHRNHDVVGAQLGLSDLTT